MTTSQSIKLTRARVEALAPAERPYHVAITDVPGLRVTVHPTGRKTYSVYKKPRGARAPVRVTLGVHGQIPVDGEQGVKALAAAAVAALARGENPNADRRAERAYQAATGITLRDAFDAYLKGVKLAPLTVAAYINAVERHLAAWLDVPLKTITGDMIKERHAAITREAGPYAANGTMRVLRAVWNGARAASEGEDGVPLLPETPTRKLGAKGQRRLWNRETRRRDYVAPDQMRAWFASLDGLPEDYRDYFTFVVLTGCRRREAAGLTWADVDLSARTFTVHDPKNHEPLVLPLSDYLTELLTRRHKVRRGEGLVFAEVGAPIAALAAAARTSGVRVSVHGLRRTFATVADQLDIGPYTLKALLNHRSGSADRDVTAGYVVIDVERLRGPMQKITDYVLGHAGVREPNVIPLDVTRQTR